MMTSQNNRESTAPLMNKDIDIQAYLFKYLIYVITPKITQNQLKFYRLN